MKSYDLSKREVKRMVESLKTAWPTIHVDVMKRVRVVVLGDKREIYLTDSFIAAKLENDFLPFLQSENILERFPQIVVDMGAVPYICNGADVMRPGIISFEGNFKAGELVVVREQSHRKFLAVGRAVLDSGSAKAASKGKVLANLHYVGDGFWESYKEMLGRV